MIIDSGNVPPTINRLYGPEDYFVGRIHGQLGRLLKIKQRTQLPNDSPQPLTREQLGLLIETAFWASLRTNEGRTTRVCVAAAASENFPHAVTFAEDVPYEESQIVKLAPAVPRSGCLVVSPSAHNLNIRGFADTRPGSWMDTVTIDITDPGTLLVAVGPFQPYAVLRGQSSSIIAGSHANLAVYLQRVLRKALRQNDVLETQAVWRESLVLADIARTILAHGHGGMVLIVPSENGAWVKSLSSFPYRFTTPDTTIRDVIRQELHDTDAQGKTLQRLSEAPIPEDLKNLAIATVGTSPWGGMARGVRATASLAAVDGAIVITQDLRVLGFGVKISVESTVEARVCMFGPESSGEPVIPSPLEDVGGTRHQSAARFAAANRDAVALVISQDRHISVMHWDESLNSVAVVRNVEWWI